MLEPQSRLAFNPGGAGQRVQGWATVLDDGIQISVLPLSSHVTLNKSPNFPVPQFPYL